MIIFRFINTSKNNERVERYSRPRIRESQYNLRGKSKREKQKVFDRMDYLSRLEADNREREKQKKIRKEKK